MSPHDWILVILCICVYDISAQCLFGPDCKYDCNCEQGIVCEPMSGCLAGLCARGFGGRYCQRENVALGRRTQNSGTYCEGSKCLNSKYAVDGKLNTDISFTKDMYCAHTNRDNSEKYWSVFLDKKYQIYRFVIYNRGEMHKKIFPVLVGSYEYTSFGKYFFLSAFKDRQIKMGYRLRGFKLEVGDSSVLGKNYKECYKDQTSNGSPGTVIKQTCENNQPLLGDIVRITIDSSEPLALCEVILNVCTGGWYGEDCDKQCQSEDRCASCGTKNVYCEACVDGRWGIHCDSFCFCENGISCNKSSGKCPGRCAAGYTGPQCDQVCDGFFGPDCQHICGKCSNGAKCDHVTGQCPTNDPQCQAGKEGTDCRKNCSQGRYGPDCKFTCGWCLHTCDIATRYCHGETKCQAGWQGQTCQTPCIDGTYGKDCSQKCGKCVSGNCDIKTGDCSSITKVIRCDHGYIGEKCDNECSDGLYGEDCREICGNCFNGNITCNHGDGRCEEGCIDGWTGNFCKQEDLAMPNSVGTSAIVGGTIGGIVIVLIVAVTCYCLGRHRSRDQERREPSSNVNLCTNISEIQQTESPSIKSDALSSNTSVGQKKTPKTNLKMEEHVYYCVPDDNSGIEQYEPI